jgi:GT2 family glycosyltransferase
MDTRAPAVVAVVVTTGPAPRLEATLASLGEQDYAQLSVLVLANGESTGVEGLVARVLPSAFVRILDDNLGFAAAANEALGMVEGATFLCFCHDDVELTKDAVHQLVEEAFRSNAGIVSPKFVRPEDHTLLLHVGKSADRFGVMTERVEPGEVDQGQHDISRDVFVAPGGVTLVRADLFATLGGFDPAIVAMGEDLDLCWRAQVAGSRVVVAASAVVAHHELLANGLRALSAPVAGPGTPTMGGLVRRHRLATMLTCYRRTYLAAAVALLVVLELGEVAIALVGRDRERAHSIAGSWRWNLSKRRWLRSRRRALAAIRVLDDHEVRRLQVAGASRLTRFGTRLVHEGVDAARGTLGASRGAEPTAGDEPLDRTVGFGAAFSDDSSFDELDDLGHRGSRIHSRLLASRPAQALAAAVVAVCFMIGVRNLVAMHLPLVGRLAPLDSWWVTWRHYFATWSPAGVGSGAPGSPGFGVLGVAGTLVLGRMGILARIALVFSIPVGALGVWRLLGPIGSRRARLVGAFSYLLLALGPNLVAQGRLDGLAALAVVPFVVRRLLVTAGVHPFAIDDAPRVHVGLLDPAWRTTRRGQLVLLGALEAAVAALDPTVAVAVVVAAVGLFVGGAVVGDLRPRRLLGVALWSTLVAAVLLAPLTIDAFTAGTAGVGVFGAVAAPWSEPGLGALLRLSMGPFGTGPLAWLLPAAALLALLVGRRERLSAAAKFAGMGVASLLTAILVVRHLLGPFAPDVATLLVPYAIAVAALVGTGVAAFEQDVSRSKFGWRQLATAAALLAVAVGVIPFVQSLSTGRFGLPPYGFDSQLSLLAAPSQGGARTLWLGDPRALPLDSWTIEPGLAYATSTDGLPGEADLFAPPSGGAAGVLARDIKVAMRGDTVQLGRLLAAAGVTSVVVVSAMAPTLPGTQEPLATPLPGALLPALRRQRDLDAAPGGGTGVDEFSVTEAHGVIARRPQPLLPTASAASFDASRYWVPALSAGGWRGRVPSGTLLATLAPSDDFSATLDGRTLVRSSAYGWAESWRVPTAGTAQVELTAAPLNALLAAAVLVAWAAVVFGALGIDRLLRVRAALLRARREGPTAQVDAAPVPAVPPAPAGEGASA